MRKFTLALVVALLFLSSLAACRQSADPNAGTSGYVMTLAFEPAVPVAAPSVLSVTIHDAEGKPVDDATLQIRGDMAHAGMLPLLAAATGTGNGVYRTDFDWTMSGDWIVTIIATLPDGRLVTQEFPVTVAVP